jgi:hypothetical protein
MISRVLGFKWSGGLGSGPSGGGSFTVVLWRSEYNSPMLVLKALASWLLFGAFGPCIDFQVALTTMRLEGGQKIQQHEYQNSVLNTAPSGPSSGSMGIGL